MNAEIVSIGDELLIGQVINSNQAFIAERLNRTGVYADRMTTVGDTEGDILKAFASAQESHDLVVVTGGLGPTHDDITRSCICTFFDTDLVEDPEALENIKRIFERRKMPMLERNVDQARVPRGCTVIPNRLGTAPGYRFERSGKVFVAMPGVPFEMKEMMDSFVVPFLAKRAGGMVIRHRTLKTTGIAESFLAERVGDVSGLFRPDEGISLAYLPSPMGVRLRITARGTSVEEVEQRVARVETALREKAGRHFYGTDDEEMEEIVGKLLAERRMTIAVAESCTGGLITDRLTNVPGSSRYFDRGLVAYSNESKIANLEVASSLIERHGAVSREVAAAMAQGVRSLANTDVGLSTTGIAGPDGGTAEKPVGLVWIGYADRTESLAVQFNFGNDRRRVKERAAQAALEIVRRRLLRIAVSG